MVRGTPARALRMDVVLPHAPPPIVQSGQKGLARERWGAGRCAACTPAPRRLAAALPALHFVQPRPARGHVRAGAMFAFADNFYNGPVVTLAHGLMSTGLVQVSWRPLAQHPTSAPTAAAVGALVTRSFSTACGPGRLGCLSFRLHALALTLAAAPVRPSHPSVTRHRSHAARRPGSRPTPRCGTRPPGFCRR